ncbi:RNA methyltransferase [Stieleria sp. JC731]|uniref:TrmH family RNA methyltransferase n=1 Tax=Pirellulaceae TaxID=2691357 RepID=UPI001E6447FD|nr:RNA methyltransferase [Stieleria sp. JC731]MCC9602363.1 RNA methyltransferase [Stieleria sp. JC731]
MTQIARTTLLGSATEAPELADFRNLKFSKPNLQSSHSESIEAGQRARHPQGRHRGQPFIVAEGRKLCARMIQSGCRIRSLVVEQGFDLACLPLEETDFPIYELSSDQISQLAGFNFHRGVLASADRPNFQPIDQFAPDELSLAFVGISDQENVGSMLRSAAAFGIRQVLIDTRSVDPYSRRCLRVSMGAALTMTVFQSSDIVSDLAMLSSRNFHCLAATLADDSVSMDEYVTRYNQQRPPCVLVLGNEGDGLPVDVQHACSHRVRISMRPTHQGQPLLDSLNVSVAAAILMHGLSKPWETVPPTTVAEPSAIAQSDSPKRPGKI